MSAKKTYDESSIKVLKGLDGVRKRPAMYIGDTSVEGFHHLVYEVLDNAIDEAVAGFCTEINVCFHKDGKVSVSDNGRGIPVKTHPTEKIPTVDVVMTMLHAGGKFGGEDSQYKTSGGLHGVGISVVNALSEWIDVTVKREGVEWFRRYEKGLPTQKNVEQVRKVGKKDTGTVVSFMPDMSYFRGVSGFQKNIIVRRLKELAYLNEGLKITLSWEADGTEQVFRSISGLTDYVKYLLDGKTALHDIIRLKTKDLAGCSIDLAFVYDEGYEGTVHTFANNINTIEGGVHRNAILDAMTKVIHGLAASYGLLKTLELEPNKSDIEEGLTLVLSVRVPEPQFGGQTKTKLSNDDLRKPFGEWMIESIQKTLKSRKDVAKVLAKKVIDAIKTRDAARKAKDLARKKSSLSNKALAGKLKDCTSKNPEICELYVCEGDSAGGTLEDARDRTFQAVLPLKGKILNVSKTVLNKALENKEIASIISALNVKVSHRDVDYDDLRYHKIILLADADVDGGHITCLLLTLFFKHMRKLIEEGFIYVCELPLYRVRCRGKVHYLKDDVELNEFKKKNEGVNLDINRFKGLGEMNAAQLEEVATNPATRVLKKIHLEDEIESKEMVNCLMGMENLERKNYLQKNLSFEEA